MRMNDDRTKPKEVIKCSVEKETIPKNQVDLKLLRSTFERSPSDQRQGHSFSDPAGSLNGIGDDVVDHSQPSMAEVLVKFRRLERSRRPQTETGRRVRSSSAEGYERLTFSDGRQESGLNRRSFEFEDSEEQDTTPQIRNLVALFSHMEGKKSGKKRQTDQQRFSGTYKGMSLQKDRELSQKGQELDGDGEAEMPEEGAVQALLLQWKALEKPLKKRKSWMEIQASRQADQRKGQTSWTPAASQKTPVIGQKSPGVSPKGTVTFQHPVNTSKVSTVASQNTTRPSQNTTWSSQRATLASQSTSVAPQKTQVTPQKTHVAPQKTHVASQKTHVESYKSNIQNGGDKNRLTSIKDSRTPSRSLQNSQEQGSEGDFHDRTGKEKEPEDDHVTFDGIAKNMAEKFRQLERRNASSDELDSPPKRKQYKWEVNSPASLGRPQGHSSHNGPVVVTFDTTTVTPPSSPEPGHVSDQRKPDLVEHSNAASSGWKSELEEFPLPSQTKNLRAKFEAVPVHD